MDPGESAVDFIKPPRGRAPPYAGRSLLLTPVLVPVQYIISSTRTPYGSTFGRVAFGGRFRRLIALLVAAILARVVRHVCASRCVFIVGMIPRTSSLLRHLAGLALSLSGLSVPVQRSRDAQSICLRTSRVVLFLCCCFLSVFGGFSGEGRCCARIETVFLLVSQESG